MGLKQISSIWCQTWLCSDSARLGSCCSQVKTALILNDIRPLPQFNLCLLQSCPGLVQVRVSPGSLDLSHADNILKNLFSGFHQRFTETGLNQDFLAHPLSTVFLGSSWIVLKTPTIHFKRRSIESV